MSGLLAVIGMALLFIGGGLTGSAWFIGIGWLVIVIGACFVKDLTPAKRKKGSGRTGMGFGFTGHTHRK